MEISRDATHGRTLILLVSLAVLAVISVQAGKATLASYRSASPRPQDWLRAAQLEPGNGDYWDRLGIYREYDFDNSDLTLAIQYYQKALERNPRSDLYWMHLAGAYEMTGDAGKAREAYEKAKAAYPISAEVAWNYGNFLLRQSQLAAGFTEIQHAVLTDPHLLPLAISRGWQSDPDVSHLFRGLLPPTQEAYFGALDYFCSIHEDEAAMAAWKRLLALKQSLQLPKSFPFLDELIQQQRADDAKQVWREALTAAEWPSAAPEEGSIIWNGGFETEIANGGLDWREVAVAGGSMNIDTTTYHSGTHSLRLDFLGGSNVDFVNVTQYAPVEPTTRYHFRGYLRTDDISTESGFRFVLLDPNHPAELPVSTPDLTGTNAWTPVEASVTTGPETHFLLIQLRRLPSRLFDNKLSGTVWVDDVSLTPLTPGTLPGSR